MSVSKLNASVASVTNEFTAALAHLNFNFALVRVEPPREYDPLGTALSRVRRQDAEAGTHHQTARKLGALFNGLIPSTPALIKAYGTRVSEISRSVDVNPSSSSSSAGIFAEQVGIDATSIWAAATSGPSAIAAHLLACMVARMFTPSEATSLWHELVEQRRAQLIHAREEGLADSSESFVCQLEISRLELSSWDASVRAWIQSADQAKSAQQSRLMSAIENVKLPIQNEETILESVKMTWTKALQAMENLVNGIAQSVYSAAVLVGLSAWHIYPDLLVLNHKSNEPWKFQDHLVASGGLLTLGLKMDAQTDDNIFWSLPLAYLRYYGDPVVTRGTIGLDNTRITSEDLAMVMLGCVLRCWKEPSANLMEGATWFPRILELLREVHSKDGDTDPKLKGILRQALLGTSWLRILADASTRLLEADQVEFSTCEKLVGLGRRRAGFLSSGPEDLPPLCGLRDPAVVIRLLIDTEMRIGFLRKFATDLKLPAEAFIIKYKTEPGGWDVVKDLWEYATVAPLIVKNAAKRTWQGRKKDSEGQHARWIITGSYGSAYDENVLKLNPQFVDNVDFGSFLGDEFSAAIYRLKRCMNTQGALTQEEPELSNRSLQNFQLSTNDAKAVLTRGRLDIRRLLKVLAWGIAWNTSTTAHDTVDPFQRTLRTFASIIDLYKVLPGASISTRILSKPLALLEMEPFKSVSLHDDRGNPRALGKSIAWSWPFERHHAFACLAYCESGSCQLHSDDLKDVFALSSGNSIFVASRLLCDPSEEIPDQEIRRLVGNIGRPGLALLIPPADPKMRKNHDGAWAVINHKLFNQVLEDCFQQTSLHLTFTEYTMPLSVQSHGSRDSNAYLIESVVSIHDRGQWIADVDVLKTFSNSCLNRQPPSAVHDNCSLSIDSTSNLTMVDNWDELLEPPEGDFVARAYGNWCARLALAAMCVRLGYGVYTLPSGGCCVECYYKSLRGGMGQQHALIC